MKTKATKPSLWVGWHFLPDDGRLRHGDGRKPRVGQWLKAKGPLVLRGNGMLASRRAIDALRYAPGAIACLVELRGEIIEGNDNKAVARERRIIAKADATKLLHEFACHIAEQALHRERKARREPNKRSWDVIAAKRNWLRGKITSAELDMTRAAARDAEETAGVKIEARAAPTDVKAQVAAQAAAGAAWAAIAAAWEVAAEAAAEAAAAAQWAAVAARKVRAAQNKYLERRLRKLLSVPSVVGGKPTK